MAMTVSEWIEAASEVLSDVEAKTCASDVNELLRKYGAKAVVFALEDAANAALEHCGEGNGTGEEQADAATVRSLDEVRGHLRMAGEHFEARP